MWLGRIGSGPMYLHMKMDGVVPTFIELDKYEQRGINRKPFK